MERSRAIQSRPVERNRSVSVPSQMRQAPVRQRRISTPSPMPRQAPVSRSTAPSRPIGGGHFGGHR